MAARPRSVVVARAEEIGPGERRIVEIGGRSIGVFNVSGRYYAVRNRCPHQGGPLCEGMQFAPLGGGAPGEYPRGGETTVIRCPWHGWEFDLRTGASWFDPDGTRVRSYPARLADADGEPLRAETLPARREGAYVVVEIGR